MQINEFYNFVPMHFFMKTTEIKILPIVCFAPSLKLESLLHIKEENTKIIRTICFF